MTRKYNVVIKYENGDEREYVSAQPLSRTKQICKYEDGAIYFRINKINASGGWKDELVCEYTKNGSTWVSD